jgi:hypothetical protein
LEFHVQGANLQGKVSKMQAKKVKEALQQLGGG